MVPDDGSSEEDAAGGNRFFGASPAADSSAGSSFTGVGTGSPPLPLGVRQRGGVLSTFRGKHEFRRALSNQSKAKDFERLRHEYDSKVAAAEDSRVALEREERKLRSLRGEAEAGTLEDPARLTLQEREVNKAWERLAEAEKTRDAAELVLHRVSDEGTHAARDVHRETADAASVAHARHAGEVDRARRTVSVDRTVRAASEDAARARVDEASSKGSEARKHQSRSVQRLRETHSQHKARRAEAEQVRESNFQHDANRLLTLKHSVDQINKQIRSSNEVRKKKEEKVKEEQNRRKKELLAEGQNPYEVWRREEMEAEKQRQKEKLAAATEMRQENLLEQLMEEEGRYKSKRKEEKKKQLEAEEFQREMGNYAKEKKIAAYIQKVTVGNVDVLDPTGTAQRIDPSKVTVQRTHGFGIGRARPDEIAKVEREVGAASAALARSRPVGSPDAAGVLESPVSAEEEPRPRPPVVRQAPPAPSQAGAVQGLKGKEWTGDAFLVKPNPITFDDFEVGKKYKQVVEVTNVSLALRFNQFKLLPLEDRIKDFFDIDFQPAGRMSPGVTTRITVWFNPKVNESIKADFPILAMTGRMDVPLLCNIKKTVLTLTPPDLDFKQVQLGESEQRVLTVRNLGALPARFALEPVDEPPAVVSWEPQTGEFGAHSATRIAFSFAPKAVGKFETTWRLSHGSFGDSGFTEEVQVLVRGECLDVLIHIEQETYDLKTCVFGHIFRESIMVMNRHSVAMKIQVEKPKLLEGELALNPTLAYIQGKGQQAIQVKFSPKEDFLDKNPQYRDTAKKLRGAFRIPVRIVGAEQQLPVHAELVGVLTTDRVSFEPPSVAFGKCFVGSSVASRLTLVNESQLPQKFAFMRLPPCLCVLDVPVDVLGEERSGGSGVAVLEGGGSGALGTLLPQERRDLCLVYAPESATELNCKVCVKVICGSLCARESTLEVRGQGAPPLLKLSHTQLDMASIPSGCSSKESVVITNVSKTACAMELLLPPKKVSGLEACPVCCTLQPEESRRLQLTFKPSRDYVELLRPPSVPTEAANGTGAAGAEEETEEQRAAAATAWEQKLAEAEQQRQQTLKEVRECGGRRWEAEAGTVHAVWKLAICMRPQAQGSNNRGRAAESLLYLGVNTCVLQDALSVEPRSLDFEDVPAQQRKPLTLLLRSLDDSEHELHIDTLPEQQCFTVLSAPRNFGGGRKPLELVVEFKPRLAQIYQTSLQLRTQSTRVQVPLVGRGVRPVLHIEPEGGILHLGSVIYNKDRKDFTTGQMLVKNSSPFELAYSMETVVRADPNHTGPPPFTLAPSTGTVEPNGQKSVTVTFRPHRPLELFREKVFVNVPNQEEPAYVFLYGHCFEYQAYALSGVTFSRFGPAEVKPPPVFDDALRVGAQPAGASGGSLARRRVQQREFHLQFERGEKLRPLHLLLGTSMPPGTPVAPQNTPASSYKFEIVPSEFSSYFSIEAPEGGKVDSKGEGQLVPGTARKQVADAGPEKQVKVLFRFNPPKETNLTYGGVTLDVLAGLGQWVTCKVNGLLSGGFVPPGEPAAQELSVTLKAYLQHI